MFVGREKYWGKVAAIALVSFFAIVVVFFLVADYFSLGQARLEFSDETTPKVNVEAPAAPNLPAGKVEDIDFESYSTELASHIGLKQGEIRLDAIDKMRLYFAPEPGTNMVNLTSSTFERDDGSVMIFARNNLPDDSVFAEEVYAVFSGPGGVNKFDQTLATYGLRMKCRRGENAMEWTTELCP